MYSPIGVSRTNTSGATRAMVPYCPKIFVALETLDFGKLATGSWRSRKARYFDLSGHIGPFAADGAGLLHPQSSHSILGQLVTTNEVRYPAFAAPA